MKTSQPMIHSSKKAKPVFLYYKGREYQAVKDKLKEGCTNCALVGPACNTKFGGKNLDLCPAKAINKIFQPRYFQTERQKLALNYGQTLGAIGMIQAQVKLLQQLGAISADQVEVCNAKLFELSHQVKEKYNQQKEKSS